MTYWMQLKDAQVLDSLPSHVVEALTEFLDGKLTTSEKDTDKTQFLQALYLMDGEEPSAKLTKKISLLLQEYHEDVRPITPELFKREQITATKACRKHKIILKGDGFKDKMSKCVERIRELAEENPSQGMKNFLKLSRLDASDWAHIENVEELVGQIASNMEFNSMVSLVLRHLRTGGLQQSNADIVLRAVL